jgi:starvation-inducible DNA-binding protein
MKASQEPERTPRCGGRCEPLTGFGWNAIAALSEALNGVLADAFGLYLKTKNFHWHVSDRQFRHYHLLFDEQAGQILAMTDALAERVRKIGGSTLRSLNQAAAMTRVPPNENERVAAADMLAELHVDNRAFLEALRDAHAMADHHDDVATASLLENWIDQAEQRIWFLRESVST